MAIVMMKNKEIARKIAGKTICENKNVTQDVKSTVSLCTDVNVWQ